jgi:hypothetical protein
MSKLNLLLGATISAGLLLSSSVQAQSMVEGIYQSNGDANGKGKCTLTLRGLDQEHKYGDELFKIESSGDGACEWSAVGLSKNFAISAGLISSAGAQAFVTVTFPYGPAGNHAEVTAIDADGSLRFKETFVKQDKVLTGGG